MLSMEFNLCLICGSKEIDKREDKNSDNFNCSTEKGDTTGISQQLNVIFILRKVLQVPSVNLEKYLVEFGNPSNWKIKLCEQCTQLINKVKDLHLIILETEKKLKKIQKEIVDKAKLQDCQSSLSTDNPDDNLIYTEIRQFVKNNNYDDHFRSDPILEGNQLIKKLLNGETPSLSTEVKIETDPPPAEEPFHDNLDDYYDDNWVPSPEPIKATRVPRKKKAPPAPPSQDQDKRTRKRRQLKIEVESPEEPPDDNFKDRIGAPPEVDISSDNFDDDNDWEPEQKPKRSPRKRKPRSRSSAPAHTTTQKVSRLTLHKCDKCSRKFREIAWLFLHLEKKHSINQLSCPHPNCSKILASQDDCRIHQKQHGHRRIPKEDQDNLNDDPDDDDPDDKKKDKLYGCDHCNFREDTVPILFSHLEKSHPDKKEEGLRCPFAPNCDRMLTGVYEWRNHKHAHKLSTPVTCELCGATLTIRHLKRHITTHHFKEGKGEGEGDGGGFVRCRVVGCDGTFFTKEGLEKHLKKMHGGGGDGEVVKVRFSCAFCGKGFFRRRNLERHEHIHKNKESRPFICEICGRGFVTGQYLYDHKRYAHYRTSHNLKKIKKFQREMAMAKVGEGDGNEKKEEEGVEGNKVTGTLISII